MHTGCSHSLLVWDSYSSPSTTLHYHDERELQVLIPTEKKKIKMCGEIGTLVRSEQVRDVETRYS